MEYCSLTASDSVLVKYLKSTFRDISRHRLLSTINIMGLALGLSACLLMYSYIRHELGFDGFHEKSANIYRLNEVQSFPGTAPQHVALSMYPMGPALRQKYPQIDNFVRLISQVDVPVFADDQLHYVSQAYVVDNSFFDLFDFPFRHGSADEAFRSPGSVVITEASAIAMFGEANAIGQRILYGSGTEISLVVSGVLQNVSPQSHIQFDALIPVAALGTEYDNRNSRNWGGNWLNTYLLLEEGSNIAALEAQFPEFLTEHMGPNGNNFYELYLQPLSAIHLDSANVTHDYQNINKSSRSYIYIFLVLAFFVLIIAAINFMNLTTASLLSRIKEVGVRKSVGASQGQIAGQILGVSILFATVAGAIALGLTWLALPVLNVAIDRTITFNPLADANLALAIAATTLLTGVLAGIYPAMKASSFTPVQALNKNPLVYARKVPVQSVLVVLQFAVSIGLIIATVLVSQQLSFIQRQDIGLNKDQVLLLPADNQLRADFATFKQELLTIPGVINVTASSQRLGNNLHQGGFQVQGDGPPTSISPSNVQVELDYLAFHEIELLDGRDFSRDIPSDVGQAFIVNEAMLRFLEWDDIEGKGMRCCGNEQMGEVIGLVRDFNFNSLHHEIQPLVIYATERGFSEISVKLDATSMATVIPSLEQKWKASGISLPFRYEFLDSHFEQLYRGDQQAGTIVGSISLLTIVIASLGLFGLTALTLEKRTKEIGIRKVLGASVADILILVNKQFSLLVVCAFILATPVVWYFINGWLNGFAFRIGISPWVFLAGGMAAALIALLTISSRVIQTTGDKAVNALRNE